MKKFATISNFIYLDAFAHHAYFASIVAIPLAILGITSGIYHYLYAWSHVGLSLDRKKLKLYQNLDVASIYLVLGVYPFHLAGGWWALFLIPCLVMAYQKLRSDQPWDSHVLIPIVAVAVFAVAFMERETYIVLSALGAMVAALIVSKIGDYYLDKGHHEKYDRFHADWHHYSGIAFIIIV